MTKLFIPNDRIGLQTAQKSIPGTYAALNALLAKGAKVNWHTDGLRLASTPSWPEGHYYQCGFSLEATSETKSLIKEREIDFEELRELPQPSQYELRPLQCALFGRESRFP